jgi:hypothetical protein
VTGLGSGGSGKKHGKNENNMQHDRLPRLQASGDRRAFSLLGSPGRCDPFDNSRIYFSVGTEPIDACGTISLCRGTPGSPATTRISPRPATLAHPIKCL